MDTIRVVYQTYGRLVFSIAHKVLGDTGLAEDATQQTFVQAGGRRRATTRADRWRPGSRRSRSGSPSTSTRRERRHRNLDDIDTAQGSALVVLPPSVEQIHDVAEVRRALDALPTPDRELIRMQHFDELSHAEIAVELEIPVGTVKSRTFRAHRRLAETLGHLRTETAEGGTRGRG